MPKRSSLKFTPAVVRGLRPGTTTYEKYGQNKLMLRVRPNGGKTWYCEPRRHQRILIGAWPHVTVSAAELKAFKYLQAEERGDDPRALVEKKDTLGAFIKDGYTAWLQAKKKRRAEKCLSDRERDFGHLYGVQLRHVTAEHLDSYVVAQRKSRVSDSTIKRGLNNLQSVFTRAVEARRLLVTRHPWTNWENEPDWGEAPRIARVLTGEEYKRLRAVLNARDERNRQERASAYKWRAERGYPLLSAITAKEYSDHLHPMVLLALNTGLRFGEIAKLEWRAVDFQANAIDVSRTLRSRRSRAKSI